MATISGPLIQKTSRCRTSASGMRLVMVLSLVLSFTLGPVAEAAKLQLSRDIVVRDVENRQVVKGGILAKGSVVEIPDDFLLPKNGPPDFELSLNNWLDKAGYLKTSALKNGMRAEFHFPVRVYYAAPGSEIGRNEEVYVPFKNLAMKENKLVVVRTVKVPSRAAVDTQRRQQNQAQATTLPRVKRESQQMTQQLEGSTSCPGGCDLPDDSALMELNQDLRTAFASVDSRKSKLNWNQSNLLGIKRTFERTCKMNFNDFLNEMTEIAGREGVPVDLLLGMMSKESSGNCRAVGDKGKSRGLFQVGGASFDPIRNLKAAIKVLKGMRTHLFSGDGMSVNGKWIKPFDLRSMSSADSWRLTLSAYNGGSTWIYEAKADLERFNARKGTQLDSNKYEHLRTFYLRRWLTKGNEREHFGTTRGGRSAENAALNLAHVEAILGRPSPTSGSPTSFAQLWKAYRQND